MNHSFGTSCADELQGCDIALNKLGQMAGLTCTLNGGGWTAAYPWPLQ